MSKLIDNLLNCPLFKKIFRRPVVIIINNQHKKYPWLESDKYYYVNDENLGHLLFTQKQIDIAQDRAKHNFEDINNG